MAEFGGGSGGRGPGEGSAAGRMARDVARMQATLLGRLREEIPADDADAFAEAAGRLAEAFGAVTAAAVEPVAAPGGPRGAAPQVSRPAPVEAAGLESLPSLYEPGQMRRRLDQMIETHQRYGHPFCLAVFDVSGPGTRDGGRSQDQSALTVVGAALRENVRLVDESFPLEEEALCVLAPNQNTVGGVQMSERLLGALAELEAAGGLPIEIAAGVAACPEHGAEADELLRKADEAMWRARAVGQPVGIGLLQDR